MRFGHWSRVLVAILGILIAPSNNASIYNQEVDYIIADNWPIDDPDASLSQARRILNSASNDTSLYTAALEGGKASMMLQRYRPAHNYFSQALQLARNIGKQEYIDIAEFHYVDSLFALDQHAEAISTLKRNSSSELRRLQLLEAYLFTDQTINAQRLSEAIISQNVRSGNLRFAAYAHAVYGEYYAARYLYFKAKKSYSDAIDLLNFKNYSSLIVQLTIALAQINQKTDDQQQAIAATKMLLTRPSGDVSTNDRLTLMLLLIEQLIDDNQFAEARENAAIAAALSESEDDLASKQAAILLWGLSYARQGIYQQAMKRFESLVAPESLLKNQESLLIRYYNQLATIYLGQNNLEQAKSNYIKALRLARKNNVLKAQYFTLENLSQIAATEENYKAAYQYRMAMKLISEGLHEADLKRNQFKGNAELIREIDRLKMELEDVRAHNSNLQEVADHQANNYHNALSGSVLLIILFFGWYVIQQFGWADVFTMKSKEKSFPELRLDDIYMQDPLTETYNRAAIEDIVRQQAAFADIDHATMCLMMVVMDNYFDFLDDYGHDSADLALVTLSDTLSNLIRETDQYGRWNEEDFMVVLPNTGLESAKFLANTIKNAVENMRVDYRDPETGETHALSMTISVCVGEYHPEKNEIDSVMSRVEKSIDESRLRETNQLSHVEA